jgi:hypothetical protein
LCATLLPACGSSKPALNEAVVERAVAQSILKQRHIYATVDCPPNVPQQAGRVFTCTAHLDVGTYPVAVTEVDGKGNVRWATSSPLVILDIHRVETAIARSVRHQRHLTARVTCPRQVIQRAGVVFTCTATINGREASFTVTEVDGNGHVRYVAR